MRNLRLLRNVRLGIKTLLLHKMRSLLTMLGVVFGVGSVVAMLAVGEGASQEALARIRKLGANNIMLTAQKPAEDEQAGQRRSMMSIYGLLYEDDLRIRETMPTVELTVPVKLVRKNARLGDREMELRIVGTTPDWFKLIERPVLAGRVLHERDMTGNAGVAVLTETGARKLLATRHAVGEPLTVGDSVFTVIAIVRSETGGGGNVQTPDRDVDAYIPLTTARERYGDTIVRRSTGSFEREQVELHQIIVKVREDFGTAEVEPTADAIEHMLERFHRRKDYRMNVPLALLREAEATKRTFNVVLGSIAGISLLVGGIGIMNIMLASVTERTREIGVRRAIGAKRRQIVGQFLIETMVLSTIGGLIGIAIGYLLPLGITRFAGMPTQVPMYAIVLSLGISVGVGIVFGLYPAIRAAYLDPIVALRHE